MTSQKNPTRETLLSDFSRQAMDYGLEFSRPTLSQFVKYEEELLRWNDKINLVSLKRPEELWTKHFLDSLSAAPFILHREGNLLDLGSGGGFPGLPLKLVFPELKLFLLESSRKKSSFLNQAIRLLGLPGARVINERVENTLMVEKYRHRFDTVISRAAFKLPDLVRSSAYFLAGNGIMIAMKGSQVLEGELAEAQAIAPAVGLAFLSYQDVKNERGGERRIILVFKRYPPLNNDQ